MPEFKTFSDIEAHLDRLGLFHMDLSLSRMNRFAAAWSGAIAPVIHLVGTNGKGSTATFLERIAREHGLTTGLHTSPHFLDVRERIRVNGQKLKQADWVRLGNELNQLAGDFGLTYFEWLTCLSALAFAAAQTDLAVMEAGMGGRYDATCVFEPSLTLLSPVGLDHESVLGSSLAEIAVDKSHAIRPKGLAITAPQEPEVMAVYQRRASEVGARLCVAEAVGEIPLGLSGPHQLENAGLAVAGWEALCGLTGWANDPEAVGRGLALARLPGRFQIVPGDPCFVLDGAHNTHGLKGLKVALDHADLRPDCVVFACMKDKDVSGMRQVLLGLTTGPILLPELPGCERVMPARELAGLLEERAEVVESFERTLARVREGDLGQCKTVVITGSLYLLAEFYRIHGHLL